MNLDSRLRGNDGKNIIRTDPFLNPCQSASYAKLNSTNAFFTVASSTSKPGMNSTGSR